MYSIRKHRTYQQPKYGADFRIKCSDGILYFSKYVLLSVQSTGFKFQIGEDDTEWNVPYTMHSMTIFLHQLDVTAKIKYPIPVANMIEVLRIFIQYGYSNHMWICLQQILDDPVPEYLEIISSPECQGVFDHCRFDMLNKIIAKNVPVPVTKELIREMLEICGKNKVLEYIIDKCQIDDEIIQMFGSEDEMVNILLLVCANKDKINKQLRTDLFEYLIYMSKQSDVKHIDIERFRSIISKVNT